jgi:polyphosphate kinase 2 (PPK2 family)
MSKGLVVADGSQKIHLDDIDPADSCGFKDKEAAKTAFAKYAAIIGERQKMMYAQRSYGILITADGRDGAGKTTLGDRLLQDVHLNGKQTKEFNAPSSLELSWDYMRRHDAALPPKGVVGFWSRSHLEEVTTVREHPEYLKKQNIPEKFSGKNVWDTRFEDIRNRELYWHHNGIVCCFFYLHLSKDEQTMRLKDRLLEWDHNYKFSVHDIAERASFDRLRHWCQVAINELSTKHAPRIILPADHKWVARALAAKYVAETMQKLPFKFPTLSKKERLEQIGLLEKS